MRTGLGLIGSLLTLCVFLGATLPRDPASVEGSRSSTQMGSEHKISVIPGPNKEPSANAHYLDISQTKLYELLDDPKKRVGELFHVQPALKPMVGFWLLIYGKYSLYQTVVYDREHPNIIYEVVDTRDVFQKGLS